MEHVSQHVAYNGSKLCWVHRACVVPSNEPHPLYASAWCSSEGSIKEAVLCRNKDNTAKMLILGKVMYTTCVKAY